MSLPSTKPAAGMSPPPRGSESLVCACPQRGAIGKPLILAGSFRLRRTTVDNLGCAPHRALTVIATPGVFAQASAVAMPFTDVALFAEDLLSDGNEVVGYFQIDAAESCGISDDPAYFIGVQLGSLLSPSVRCEMR